MLRLKKKSHKPALNALIWRRAEESSADFVDRYLSTAILFEQREPLLRFAIEEAPKDGLMLEFGVFEGRSINAFADLMKSSRDERCIWGFDSFQGLEEHWNGLGYKARDRFNLNARLPTVRPQVRLVPGWISDTLPGFLAEHAGPISFLHIDTDTYKPAKLILSLCKDRLQPGSIVLFDELLAHPGWQLGEHKALTEEMDAGRYEWIGFSGCRGALRVI